MGTAPSVSPLCISVWCRTDQSAWLAETLRTLAQSLSTQIALGLVGCPEPGRAAQLGEELARDGGAFILPPSAPCTDDLRAALATAPPGLFILADIGNVLAADAQRPTADAELLKEAAASGVRIVCLSPLPASLTELATLASVTVAGPGAPAVVSADASPALDGASLLRSGSLAVFHPPVRCARHFADLRDVLEQFGPVRAASVTCLSGPADGGLGARLFEALDLVGVLQGEPATIDAMWSGRGVRDIKGARGLAERDGPPPEALRNLTGEISANLRFADGRAAAVLVGDQAGSRWWQIIAVGPGGRLVIDEHRLEWVDPAGRTVDRASAGRATGHSRNGHRTAPAMWLAELLRHLHAGVLPPALQGVNWPSVLATAQAALLSCRTSAPESPATMLSLAAR